MNEINEIIEKEPLPAVESAYWQEQPSLGELYLAGPVLTYLQPLVLSPCGETLRLRRARLLRPVFSGSSGAADRPGNSRFWGCAPGD